ncbi:nicotinamide riboside transporter PnuC [Cryomorphaceae bacterium 1068]|nr:nicotinamide riboside transporter PnuC [Cryomorphaceae bacterium 1068]
MTPETLEYTAVAFNIGYVILAARENIWCWPLGIIGSALSIWLFIDSKIYAESVLFTYYVIMGFYGWRAWNRGKSDSGKFEIRTLTIPIHLGILLGGYAATVGLFFLLKTFTDAEMPLLDSFTTIFSFIATWMVAKRIIENWLYWICINALTIYLYYSRDLNVYAMLSVVYTVLAVYGYFAWRKDFEKQTLTS